MELAINWMDIELIGRIVLSVILGAIIGYEREIQQKPAGLRTHMFIGMGACLFTISSIHLLPQNSEFFIDATRIAAGIVTGTAFIGAGSIIARRGDIRGITTAASIWIVAALGLMIGLGNYLLPIVATLIAFVILRLGGVAGRKGESSANKKQIL
jgi:putative Mg2+ transporter-C (MgtC) family protein